MKVILREEVKGLGSIGSVVEVKNGYGRNYLLPRNLAVEANPKNLKYFEHQKKIMAARARKFLKTSEDLAARLSELTLNFEMQAGEDDKLFGSVTSKDIAEQIAEKGIDVDRKKIQLDDPIKSLGTHDVQIKVHRDINATVRVEVTKASS